MQNKSVKTTAYHLVYWQLIVVMGLALILLLIQGLQSSVSALLGGLAYGLPNLFFVWRVFTKASSMNPSRFVIRFFAGEIGKLFLSAALFVVVVKYFPVNMISVIMGFIGAIVAFWVVSFVYLSRHEGQNL